MSNFAPFSPGKCQKMPEYGYFLALFRPKRIKFELFLVWVLYYQTSPFCRSTTFIWYYPAVFPFPAGKWTYFVPFFYSIRTFHNRGMNWDIYNILWRKYIFHVTIAQLYPKIFINFLCLAQNILTIVQFLSNSCLTFPAGKPWLQVKPGLSICKCIRANSYKYRLVDISYQVSEFEVFPFEVKSDFLHSVQKSVSHLQSLTLVLSCLAHGLLLVNNWSKLEWPPLYPKSNFFIIWRQALLEFENLRNILFTWVETNPPLEFLFEDIHLMAWRRKFTF